MSQPSANSEQDLVDLTKSSSNEIISSPPKVTTSDNSNIPKSNEKKSPTDSAISRRKRKPKKVSHVESTNNPSDAEMIDTNLPAKSIDVAAAKDSKTDSDECETIDKIAKMVSNITADTTEIKNETAVTTSTDPQQNIINEVENKLEAMFADTNDIPKIDVNEQPAMAIEESEPKVEQAKVVKPKPPTRKRKPDANSKKQKKNGGTNGKLNAIKGKNGDKNKQHLNKIQKPKENGGRSRVKNDVAPYLQIQKDGSFNIVNQTVNGDDDADKANNKSKKPVNSEKHKGIRGLHVSTLSNKYDVDKRDSNWICVFCKLGPHKHKLGDLFGPYIVSKNSKEYSFCLEDPANDVFRQSNRNKFLPVTLPPVLVSPPKKKRKNSDGNARKVTSPTASIATTATAPTAVNGPDISDEVFTGMTPVDEQKQNYEIWFHEDCIIWSPGVYIVGSKVNGLEQAVWQSTRHRCNYCQKNGAMMCCLSRGCKKEAHVVCARKTWKLCEDFKTYCEQHL